MTDAMWDEIDAKILQIRFEMMLDKSGEFWDGMPDESREGLCIIYNVTAILERIKNEYADIDKVDMLDLVDYIIERMKRLREMIE